MTKRLRISGAVSFWCDKFQFIGIPRVGATLAVALKNRGFAPAAKGDRKGRPYACISNSPINSNLHIPVP